MKRGFFHLLGTLALVLGSWPVYAQTYPSKQIRMIVPFAPGGSTDVMARLIAAEMTKTMGQIVAVADRIIADGLIAIGSSPQQLAESLKMEADMWAKVIRSTGSARD